MAEPNHRRIANEDKRVVERDGNKTSGGKPRKPELSAKAQNVLTETNRQTEIARKLSAEANKPPEVVEVLDLFPEIIRVPDSYSDDQYQCYYKGIDPIKRKYLKGKENKEIREEINLFLRHGKIKGADCRQATVERQKIAIADIGKWLVDYHGSQPVELKRVFAERNNPKSSVLKKED